MGFLDIFKKNDVDEKLVDDFDYEKFTFKDILNDYLATLKSAICVYYSYNLVYLKKRLQYQKYKLEGAPINITDDMKDTMIAIYCVFHFDKFIYDKMFEKESFDEKLRSVITGYKENDLSLCGIINYLITHNGGKSEKFFSKFDIEPEMFADSIMADMGQVLEEELGPCVRAAVPHKKALQQYKTFIDRCINKPDGIALTPEAPMAANGMPVPAAARFSYVGSNPADERRFSEFCAEYDAFWNEMGALYGRVDAAIAGMVKVVDGKVFATCRELMESVEAYGEQHPQSLRKISRHFFAQEQLVMKKQQALMEQYVEAKDIVPAVILADLYDGILAERETLSEHMLEDVTRLRESCPW